MTETINAIYTVLNQCFKRTKCLGGFRQATYVKICLQIIQFNIQTHVVKQLHALFLDSWGYLKLVDCQ